MQSSFISIIVYIVEQINGCEINHRVKELRKAINMTQVSFSRVIALSSGYLAGIETEKRRVNNRLIKLICSSFNVSEQWLLSGIGSMFVSNKDEQIIKLAGLYKELEPLFQDYVIKEIELLLKMQSEWKKNQENS